MGKWLKRLAVLSVLGFPIAVIAVRAGMIDFRMGLSMTGGSPLLALAIFVISIITILAVRKTNPASANAAKYAIIFSLLPILGIGSQILKARSLPEIHNISTDVNDPPRFNKILAIRSSTDNPANYDKSVLADIQRKAYPQVSTLALDLGYEDAFNKSLSLAKGLGWEIVNQDINSGLIEATETTLLWGFKDDVVIRVRAAENNELTLIDLRSVSRVGRSDIGANAKRIMTFLDAVEK